MHLAEPVSPFGRPEPGVQSVAFRSNLMTGLPEIGHPDVVPAHEDVEWQLETLPCSDRREFDVAPGDVPGTAGPAAIAVQGEDHAIGCALSRGRS